VVTQVLALGLAWNFLGGSTTWVSVVLGLVAAVVLGGLLHPASVDALTDRRG
jgi:multisubunit Na+/H+ antiporter MnhE subunit